MILEAAPLHVRAGQEPAFEDAFRVAQRIIASMPGYRSHRLERCIERPGEYLLLVEWDTLEAHEQGFRGSPGYQEWKRRLHHFYEPFPTVLHYAAVDGASSPGSGSAMPDAANTSRTTDSPLSAAGKPA
ncbi:antibiotic biosynthesis monooxygenase family protein [Paracidovorax konjaci]|uniref:Heme-degrading monooxygenase HmoA n=1 Tax=Paracidovorax konjaci TaxID=32040 RepID=A0A1I1V120_9BURK|nr:Heme-degrading monooxygenase HmoA [Paracidovorax konjaci]